MILFRCHCHCFEETGVLWRRQIHIMCLGDVRLEPECIRECDIPLVSFLIRLRLNANRYSDFPFISIFAVLAIAVGLANDVVTLQLERSNCTC